MTPSPPNDRLAHAVVASPPPRAPSEPPIDDSPPPAPSPSGGDRSRSRWRRRLIVEPPSLAFGLTVALLVALVHSGGRLVDGVTAMAAADLLGVETLSIESATATGARISDIRLAGGAVQVGRLDLTYDPVRLWRSGQIDGIVVRNLTVSLTMDAAGTVTIPGRDSGGEAGAGPPPRLPADRINVEDASVSLHTPWLSGVVDVPAMMARQSTEGINVSGTGRIETDAGTAAVRFDGRLGPDESLSGGVIVETGSAFWGQDLRAEDLQGWIAVSSSGDGAASYRGQLSADRVSHGDLAFDDLRLTIVGDGASPRLLAVRGRTEGGGVSAAVDLAATETGIEAELDVEVASTVALAELLGVTLPTADALVVRASLALPELDRLMTEDPSALSASGSLEISTDGLLVEGVPPLGPARISGNAAWQDGALLLEGPELARAAVPGIAVAFTGTDEDPARVTLRPLDDWEVAAEGRLSIVTPGGRLEGHLTGAAGNLTAGRTATVTVGGLTGAVGVGPWRITTDGFDLSADQIEDRALANLAGVVDVSGPLTDAMRLSRLTVDVGAAVEAGQGTVAVHWNGCRPVSAVIEDASGTLVIADPIETCIGVDGPPLLIFDPGMSRPALSLPFGSLEVPLVLDGEPLTVAIPDGGTRLTMGEQAGVLLGIGDATVDLPASGVWIRGLEATAVIGAEIPMALELDRATAGLVGNPVAPIWAAGTGVLDAAGDLTFRVTAGGARGALRGSARGIVPADGGGRVDFSVAPIRFEPGGAQPRDVFPIVDAGPPLAAQGSLSGQGHYAWGPRRSQGAEIDVEDLTLAISGLTLRRLNGTVSVSRYNPFAIPDGEELRIGAVDAGLRFGAGFARFGVRDGSVLAVEAARLEWAGGEVAAEPFATDWDARERAVVLNASDVDLDLLSAELGIDGLEMTGRLTGRIPIRLIDDTIIIDDAILTSTVPGVIRYGAGNGGLPSTEEGVELLMRQLEDFQYQSLEIGLDGRTGEESTVSLRVRGANPAVYDGYPVALNINVSGRLDEILVRGLETAAFGERIRELYEHSTDDPDRAIFDQLEEDQR